MSFRVSPLIRKTCGKVIKYKQTETNGELRRGGYGWVCIGDERENDAFLSYRDFEPEKDEKKVIKVGTYLKFDLHENSQGYVAKNAYPITETEYNSMLGVYR